MANADDAVDGMQPKWVVTPGSIEEAGAVMRAAHDIGLALTPRGGGSKLSWGNIPSRLDAIVSMERMARVQEHAVGDLVARVEAGTKLQDLQAVSRQSGQWLPLDPPEPNATLGGIIAANASGPQRLRYGTMRDLLIGITYVLPDGTVAKAGGRVVKNVAGYDLCKLFTGSLGTVGLLVEAIVRLHSAPECARAVTLNFDSFDTLGAASQTMLHSSLVPSALEFHWQDGSGHLQALFEGVERGVEAQTIAAAVLWREFSHVAFGTTADGHSGVAEEAQPLTELKLSAPISDLHSVLQNVARIASERGVTWRMSAHAGSGIGAIDVLDGDTETIRELVSASRAATARHQSTIVVRCAPPAVKKVIDVWGDQDQDALKLMRSVKARFDPDGVLNPGRFVGGI